MITFLKYMEENKEKKDITEEDSSASEVGLKVYELGFLIVPSVVEEKLPEVVGAIREKIEKIGGVFISDQYPKLQNLSYTMFRSIEHKKQSYSQAYFGWLKFEMDSSKIADLKNSLDNNSDVLRFIIIKTVKENTIYSHKLAPKKDKIVNKTSPEIFEEKASVEDIDKSIEELVAKS